MGEFEDEFDRLGDADEHEVPRPTWRATIRGGRLMLTQWAPFLITGGPAGTLFRGRRRTGVAIADLSLHGEDADEITVRYWLEGADRASADEVLRTWAGDLGYRRIWLPDRVVELETDPERLERASVSCPTCRSRWSDGTPEFWHMVREAGMFPKWCPMCGCELPQWTVEAPVDRSEKTPGNGPARRREWPSSDSGRRGRPTRR